MLQSKTHQNPTSEVAEHCSRFRNGTYNRLAVQCNRNKHAAGDNNSLTPFVSILIPAYNAENWIADTLESAIAQTWPLKEVIRRNLSCIQLTWRLRSIIT